MACDVSPVAMFYLCFIKQGFYTYLMNRETAKFSDNLLIYATNLQNEDYYQDTRHPILKCIVLIFSGSCGISPCYAFLSLAKRWKRKDVSIYSKKSLSFSTHWYQHLLLSFGFPFFSFLPALVVFFLVPNEHQHLICPEISKCCFKYNIWFQIFSFLCFSNYPTSASRGFSVDFFRHLWYFFFLTMKTGRAGVCQLVHIYYHPVQIV